MQKFLCLTLTFSTFAAIAYNQTDLLNAQTNYQAAKANLDKSQTILVTANAELKRAESEVLFDQKRLANAQKQLQIKQESEATAKRNLATAITVHSTAGTTVDNIWKELNGKTK